MRSALFLFSLQLGLCSCLAGDADSKSVHVWQRQPVEIELRLAERTPRPGLTAAPVYGERDTVYLHSTVELSNELIARVEATKEPRGLLLDVWLTQEGAERIAALTAKHVGDHLAVLINGEVVSAPVISQPVQGTPISVVVPLPPQDVEQLSQGISKTWPLPPTR